MIRRPPRSTLFPTRRSSDLGTNFVVLPPVDAIEEFKVETSGFSAQDRKSTRLNSSHSQISYAVFCLKKKKKTTSTPQLIMFICGRSLSTNTLHTCVLATMRL